MLIFKGDKLLVRNGAFDFETLPPRVLRSSLELPPAWQNEISWCEIPEDTAPGVFPETDASAEEWVDLRTVWHRWGDEAFAYAGTAYQYMNWLRQTRFCSRCAAPLAPREEDKGLVCRTCGRISYAPLHPAVIVAVEREGKLLLAHNARTPGKRYSVLAGFVEPGESLEQTVSREIMEEVGIEVQDIRYFGSQSWPFPCSLMLGFTARWKKGELRPDGLELDAAAWFSCDDMPEIPPGVSISRKLIDDFEKRAKRKVL